MRSPSPTNYTIGKGALFFDLLVGSSYLGELHLGNAPNFTISRDVEELDHESSMEGMKEVDDTTVIKVSPSLAFTLDEYNAHNIRMAFMGSSAEVTQAAADDLVADQILSVTQGRYYPITDSVSALRKRDVGIYKITHGTVSGGPFTEGEVVTGGTSSATADVARVDESAPLGLVFENIVGDFEAAEVLTGGSSSATATSTSGAVWDATDLVVKVGATVCVKTTDYVVDSASGRIYIVPGSTDIPDAANVDITSFGVAAATFTTINGFANTSIEGRLRFVPKVTKGNSAELNIWRVKVTPSGDYSPISEEFINLEFQGKILKDLTNHATNPYLEITVKDSI